MRLFRAGELTPITVPTEAAEAVRDLLRCREDVQEDLLRWRHRLGKFLARHGRVYRDGRNWTQRHWNWLRCFRGIETLGALTLLAELGAFARFPHPRELMAYLGLVSSAASTGEQERRGRITKAGNLHARRILVEAAWHARHPPRLPRCVLRGRDRRAESVSADVHS